MIIFCPSSNYNKIHCWSFFVLLEYETVFIDNPLGNNIYIYFISIIRYSFSDCVFTNKDESSRMIDILAILGNF
jgi:hypothetical protein